MNALLVLHTKNILRKFIAICCSVLLGINAHAQCSLNVDFNTWVQEGDPANGNWTVGGGGANVSQSINGEPTFFVSPQNFINVEMTGKMRTTDNDDDYMGVVFGYKAPVGNSTVFDTWLVDWKEETSGTAGGNEGLSLVRINGDVAGQYNPYFWGHNSDAIFNVVDTDHGAGKGWVRNRTHEIKVVFTLTNIIVIVDSDTVFKHSGCFEPGRFGFYNYSQKNVTYSDFDYKLKADFSVLTPVICLDDSAKFLSVCGVIPANIATWDWDFGDGTTSNLHNPAHKFNTPGTHNIKLVLTDLNGCKDSLTKSVLVKPLPQVSLSNNITACLGDAAPNVTFTGANAVAPYTFYYQLNGAAQPAAVSTGNTSTFTVSTVAPTTQMYTLDSVQASNGCSQTQLDTTTVSVNSSPTATISGTTVLCATAGTTDITFSASNGTPPYTFSYTDPTGAPQTILSSGTTTLVPQSTTTAGVYTYSLTNISDANNCGQASTGAATVTVNSIPTASITGGTTVCTNAPSPNITFTASNGTPPYTFTYNTGGGNIALSSPLTSTLLSLPTATAGTVNYNLVRVEDANTCAQTLSATETVTVMPLLSATVTSSVPDICQGQATSWNLSASAGTAPYTFTYRIDSLNANNSSTGTITATSSTTVVASPNTYDDTLELTITGLSDASGFSCPTASTASDRLIINAIPSSIISASLGNVCEGVGGTQTITFDASANPSLPTPVTFNYYYTIDGGAPVNGSVTSNPGDLTATTTYNVPLTASRTIFYNQTVSNSTCGGGIGGGSDTIDVYPLPTATIIGTAAICETGATNITFTGATGTPPYTFTYNINGAGSYTITTTAGNSSVDLPVSNVPGTYAYNLVAVSDQKGCSNAQTGAATVTIDPLPTLTVPGGPDTICVDNTLNITTASSSNSAIAWTSNGAGNISNANTISPTYNPAPADGEMLVTLTVTINGIAACSNANPLSGTHRIYIDSLPAASITKSNAICAGETVSLVQGDAYFRHGSITWTHNGFGAPITSTGLTPVYTSTTTEGGNTVTLTMTVDGQGACSTAQATATYPLTIYELPAGTVSGGTTLCVDDAAPSIAFTANAGQAPYTFHYTKNGFDTTMATPPYTITQPTSISGNFMYTLNSIVDANNCTSLPFSAKPSTTVVVNNNPKGAFELSSKTACQNSPAQLIFTGNDGYGNYTYTYSLNGGASNTVTTINNNSTAVVGINTSAQGIQPYMLTRVSDENNCFTTYTQGDTLLIHPLPYASISGDTTICKDSTVQDIILSAGNGKAPYDMVYTLNNNSASVTTATSDSVVSVPANNNQAGIFVYALKSVTDANNCKQNVSGRVTINVVENALASFDLAENSSTIIEPFAHIYESSINAVSWQWNFDDGITSNSPDPQTHIYNDTGAYTIHLVVANSLGCFDSVSHIMHITQPILLYIPEAFTPNGDGINDTFAPKGDGIGEYLLHIYDRWGNLIFVSDDINKGWDGTANDGTEIAQIDTYIYVVEAEDINNKTYTYRGVFNLVK